MKRISLLLMGVALGCLGMIIPLQAQTYDSSQQDTSRQRGMYRDSSDIRDTSIYNRRSSTFDQDTVRQRGTYDTSGMNQGQWKSGGDSSWRKNSDTTYRSGGYQGGTQGGEWKHDSTSGYEQMGGYQSGTQTQGTGTQGSSKSKKTSKSKTSGYKSGTGSDTSSTYKSGNGSESMSGAPMKSGQKSRRSGGTQGGMNIDQLGTPTHSETNNGLSMKVWLVPTEKMQGRMGQMGEGRTERGETSDTSGTQGQMGGMRGEGTGVAGTTSGEPGQYHVVMQVRDEDQNKDLTSGTAKLKITSPSNKTQNVTLKRMKDHFGANVRLNEVGTYSFTSNVKSGNKNAESTFEFTTER